MKAFLVLAALAAVIYLTAAQPEEIGSSNQRPNKPSVLNKIGNSLKQSVKNRIKFTEDVGKALRTARMNCAGTKCNLCVNVEKGLRVCTDFILDIQKIELKSIFKMNGKTMAKRLFTVSENYPFCIHIPDLESFSICLRTYHANFTKNAFKLCAQFDISAPDMKWASLGLNCMKLVKNNLQIVAPQKKIPLERGVFHFQMPIKK